MKLLHSQRGDLDNKSLLFRNISWRFDRELKTPNNALTQKKALSPKHWPNAKKRFKIHAHSMVHIWLYAMESDVLPMHYSITEKSRQTKY